MRTETIQQTIHCADSLEGNRSYGGKADGLRFLSHNGYSVPQFYVMPHDTLQRITSDAAALNHWLAQWESDHCIKKNSRWAVRSSAGVEDGASKSYAGLFRTELNVPVSGLFDAIRKVYEGFKQVDTIYADKEET